MPMWRGHSCPRGHIAELSITSFSEFSVLLSATDVSEASIRGVEGSLPPSTPLPQTRSPPVSSTALHRCRLLPLGGAAVYRCDFGLLQPGFNR
jgi:hypothetical protein